MEDSPSFDLTELARQAGVTVRTVRYYVQQGLLPSPAARGPGVRYDESYVARLRLIRKLQREHLPLAEIRRRLEGMDDRAVQQSLAAVEQPGTPSAVEYVRHLLSRQASTAALVRAEPVAPRAFALPVSAVVRESPAASGAPASLAKAAAAGRAPVGPGPPPLSPAAPNEAAPAVRSTWERIPIAQDVELHIRRPLSREQNRIVTRLLRFIQNLLNEES